MTKVVKEAMARVDYHETSDHVNISLRYSENMGEYRWSCAGLAYNDSRLVALNRDFCELNLPSYRPVVVEVVMHELIHLKLPREVLHGTAFKEECVKYGIHPSAWTPETYIPHWWTREAHGRVPSKKPKRTNFRVELPLARCK
jgi:hypothetical protein